MSSRFAVFSEVHHNDFVNAQNILAGKPISHFADKRN
jgi:hypothetical protein